MLTKKTENRIFQEKKTVVLYKRISTKKRMEKNNFSEVRKQLKTEEERYRKETERSKAIVRMSKQSIYATMRGDIKKAQEMKKKMEKELSLLKNTTQKRIAEQEFVEAVCFLSFVEKRKIKTCKELKVQPENYMLGICDLFGELSRYAINSAIRKDKKAIKETYEIMNTLYGELLNFDFRNGDLRRKFDGTKYEVVKIERLVLEQMQ